MYILGISAFYHDSAACLIKDGEIIAAAQEERFTRKKHDFNFPKNAMEYCLKEAGITGDQLDYVGFYEKPLLKFDRILMTYFAEAPFGIGSFIKAIPLWLKEKLWLPTIIEDETKFKGKILFVEHHESHASSAFYASPFQEAAILTIDGVGEWTTTAMGVGKGSKIELFKEIRFPHSLGLLYSAFTYFTGFKVNSGEYKLMGLAPYGEPKYVDAIMDNLIDLKEDGSFKMNMKYFNYLSGLTMTNAEFEKLFGGPARKSETKISEREMDLARSIQTVTEEIMLRMCRTLHKETGMDYLCLAGGVALNCVANGRILREGPFKDIFIQPAAGDAGGALGIALNIWYSYLGNERKADNKKDFMKAAYLGPSFSDDEIETFLKERGAKYTRLSTEEMIRKTAELIASEKVVGWFQGRMEFGPRALGSRSIIGDARSREMQSTMNLKIKYRESFRPFAPTVMADKISEYFEIDRESPYMLLVAEVRKDKLNVITEEEKKLTGIDKLKRIRSCVPAITHVDNTARIQSVKREDNERYYDVINEFYKLTGCPVIINTSFNVRGEPIVCSPEHAYMCFMRTEMDYLVLGNYILDKTEQTPISDTKEWQRDFVLD